MYKIKGEYVSGLPSTILKRAMADDSRVVEPNRYIDIYGDLTIKIRGHESVGFWRDVVENQNYNRYFSLYGMSLDDLDTGMIVEDAGGCMYLVLRDYSTNIYGTQDLILASYSGGFHNADEFNTDLTLDGYPEHKIERVFKAVLDSCLLDINKLKSADNLKLIWERDQLANPKEVMDIIIENLEGGGAFGSDMVDISEIQSISEEARVYCLSAERINEWGDEIIRTIIIEVSPCNQRLLTVTVRLAKPLSQDEFSVSRIYTLSDFAEEHTATSFRLWCGEILDNVYMTVNNECLKKMNK